MSSLTRRQKQVLQFVKTYIKKNDYSPTLEEIAEHLGVSSVGTVHEHLSNLEEKGYIDREENQQRSIEISATEPMVQIPLLGTIAAGAPIEAVQEKESIAVAKNKLPKSGTIFALRVEGDSMIEENINDGDVILVKEQKTADNGQKIVALVDGGATVKKFYKEKDKVKLQPANKKMEAILVDKNQEFEIQGAVISVVETELKREKSKKKTPRKKHTTLPLNKIICGNSVEELRRLPDKSIDLVVTSPPYDDIRDYKNQPDFDLHETGKEIYRVLKDGGIAAMVIQDQTKNFGKTLTSFKTIVDWCDNIGFKLFETVIYRKHGVAGAWWAKRFRVDHEYMPIFLKGARPQYFNKEPLKIPSKHGGKTLTGGATRLTNGKTLDSTKIKINKMKCRGTIWNYLTAGDGSKLKHKHPATFPNQLPVDFIKCFAPKDGVVLDPFVGSGTTMVAAANLGRKYIGIDIAEEYCEIAQQRIKEETSQKKLL